LVTWSSAMDMRRNLLARLRDREKAKARPVSRSVAAR
jgi:hypothetical protein